jgi:hypothetical protein
MTPQLGWAFMRNGAPNTFPAIAQFAVVSPENVALAYKPMLMRRVDLNCISVTENAGPSDQGNVVVVYNVEAIPENSLNLFPVEDRSAKLLGGEAGQPPETTSKEMNFDSLRLGKRLQT